MRTRQVTISSADHRRLLALTHSARLDRRVPAENLDALEGELARATIVDPSEQAADVVSMNSIVWFRDLDNGEVEKYQLVYPPDADVIDDRISVLAPIGTALLGYRVGDVVQWRVPSGKRRLEITRVVQNRGACRSEPVGAFA